MRGFCRHQLPNTADAIRVIPVERDVVRVVAVDNRIVCGRDQTVGRIEPPRQLVERYKALPVVERVPTGGGERALESVGRITPGNPGGCEQADVSVDVGVHHVLLGRGIVAQSRAEFLPVARFLNAEQGPDGRVVVVEGGVRQRQRDIAELRPVLFRHQVGNNRAMPRRAHRQANRLFAPDPDDFLVDLERSGTVRAHVATRIAVDRALDEYVLDIAVGVREAPRHAIVAAEHYGGHRRHRCADRVQARRHQVGEIPDRRCRESEMGSLARMGLPVAE